MDLIDAEKYISMLNSGSASLSLDRKNINDLNVFPIPDGDTGDNMFMTIQAGVGAIGNTKTDLSEVAEKSSSGMLFGARGNSGVILSRIFSGIAKGFQGKSAAEVDDLKYAMSKGVEESYKAVLNPVEGTILTVFRDGVNAASETKTVSAWFDVCLKEMSESLDRTPDLLPVLKEAGVVDSGGAGLLCIFRGMASALKGEPVGADLGRQPEGASAPAVDLDAFTPESEMEFGYCTEFLLRLQSSKVDLASFDETVIKDWLTANGDSVVCFRDGSIVKVHVHTMHPGDILSHCQIWGEFLTVKVENMTLLHSGVSIKNNFRKKRKQFGTVAVVSGKGLGEAFRNAGADEVIEGGQTMNPSAQSFLDAFERVNAETVFVFPNNSNIILTAQQAAALCSDTKAIVLPTRNIGAGYVALASLDFSSKDVSEIESNVLETISSVTTGLVSKAIRSTVQDGVEVNEGEYIGFCDSRILNCAGNAQAAAVELCDKLNAGDHDVVLIFYGEDCIGTEAEESVALLQKKYPRTEFILTDGGQKVYNYIIVLC